MIEHSVYTVRRYNRFWAVLKDDQVLVTYRGRDDAVALAYSLMERGCERLEPFKIVVEELDRRQETDCCCFAPPPPRTTVN